MVPKPARRIADADTRAIEAELSAHIGMLVRIEHLSGGEGGRLSVTYRDLDQLDRLCAALSGLDAIDAI
jgi:ParB family chromosome partitioning protein